MLPCKIKLAGYRWGKKTAPIILLVHGWTGIATGFVNFIDPLLERGYQVVSYDGIVHDAFYYFQRNSESADLVDRPVNFESLHCHHAPL